MVGLGLYFSRQGKGGKVVVSLSLVKVRMGGLCSIFRFGDIGGWMVFDGAVPLGRSRVAQLEPSVDTVAQAAPLRPSDGKRFSVRSW